MSTIRTGAHWRVTIVDDGTQPPDASGHRPDARLLAVVMAGKVVTPDPELAERVAALLNFQQRAMEIWGPTDGDVLPHTPDVDYLRGAADALVEVQRQLITWSKLADIGEPISVAVVMGMIRTAAGELGVDEDAPSGSRQEPQAAETASQAPVSTPDGPMPAETRSDGWRWEPDGNGGWVSAPQCRETSCPDFGSFDFGEGTCPGRPR